MARDFGDRDDGASVALARIEAMTRPELRALWEETYHEPPPVSMSSRLLRYGLAYEAQARIVGSESKASNKAWAKIERRRAQGASAEEALSGISIPKTKGLPGGSRLVREWKGRTHEVLVLDQDQGSGRFVWNERSYRSLSAIARQITGTSRNGPAFFGLRETAA